MKELLLDGWWIFGAVLLITGLYLLLEASRRRARTFHRRAQELEAALSPTPEGLASLLNSDHHAARGLSNLAIARVGEISYRLGVDPRELCNRARDVGKHPVRYAEELVGEGEPPCDGC